MNNFPDAGHMIATLPISDIITYLERRGFRPVASHNPNALAFSGAEDEAGIPIIVVVPARKSLIDAARRFNDLVRSLAIIDATSPEMVARQIRAKSARRVKRVRTTSAHPHLKTPSPKA